MQNRGVIKVLFLSLITCGIYSIYWYYVTAQALNEEQPDDPLMNYIGAFLLGIVTCGIYELYWFYKFYKKVDTVTSGGSLGDCFFQTSADFQDSSQYDFLVDFIGFGIGGLYFALVLCVSRNTDGL